MWTKPVRLSLKLLCLYLLNIFYFNMIRLTNSFYLSFNINFIFFDWKKKKA